MRGPNATRLRWLHRVKEHSEVGIVTRRVYGMDASGGRLTVVIGALLLMLLGQHFCSSRVVARRLGSAAEHVQEVRRRTAQVASARSGSGFFDGLVAPLHFSVCSGRLCRAAGAMLHAVLGLPSHSLSAIPWGAS